MQAAEKGVELTLDISDRTPKTVSADITRIRQVILNLTSNAVKFPSRALRSSSVINRRCPVFWESGDPGS